MNTTTAIILQITINILGASTLAYIALSAIDRIDRPRRTHRNRKEV